MAGTDCAHAVCTCPVDDLDDLYCSESCRTAASYDPAEEAGCGCDHPQCFGAHPDERVGDEGEDPARRSGVPGAEPRH